MLRDKDRKMFQIRSKTSILSRYKLQASAACKMKQNKNTIKVIILPFMLFLSVFICYSLIFLFTKKQHTIPSLRLKPAQNAHYLFDYSNSKSNVVKQIKPYITLQNDEKNNNSLLSNDTTDSRMINKRMFIFSNGGFCTSETSGSVLTEELNKTKGVVLHRHQKCSDNECLDITTSFLYIEPNSKKEFIFLGTSTGLYVTENSKENADNLDFQIVGNSSQLSTSVVSIAAYHENIYFTIGGSLAYFNFPQIYKNDTFDWGNPSLIHIVSLSHDNHPFYSQPSDPVIAINQNDGHLVVGADGITADHNQSSAVRTALVCSKHSLSGNQIEPWLIQPIASSEWIEYQCDDDFDKSGKIPAYSNKSISPYASINRVTFYHGDLYIFNTLMGLSYVHKPAKEKYESLKFFTYLPGVKDLTSESDQIENSIYDFGVISYHGQTKFIFGSDHGLILLFSPFSRGDYLPKTDPFSRLQFYHNENLDQQQANSVTPLHLNGDKTSNYVMITVFGQGVSILTKTELFS